MGYGLAGWSSGRWGDGGAGKAGRGAGALRHRQIMDVAVFLSSFQLFSDKENLTQSSLATRGCSRHPGAHILRSGRSNPAGQAAWIDGSRRANPEDSGCRVSAITASWQNIILAGFVFERICCHAFSSTVPRRKPEEFCICFANVLHIKLCISKQQEELLTGLQTRPFVCHRSQL